MLLYLILNLSVLSTEISRTLPQKRKKTLQNFIFVCSQIIKNIQKQKNHRTQGKVLKYNTYFYRSSQQNVLFNYSQCFTQFILIYWFFRPQVLSFGLHSQLSLLFLVINAAKASAVFTFANLVHTSLVAFSFFFFFSFWQKHFISSLASRLNQNFCLYPS